MKNMNRQDTVHLHSSIVASSCPSAQRTALYFGDSEHLYSVQSIYTAYRPTIAPTESKLTSPVCVHPTHVVSFCSRTRTYCDNHRSAQSTRRTWPLLSSSTKDRCCRTFSLASLTFIFSCFIFCTLSDPLLLLPRCCCSCW